MADVTMKVDSRYLVHSERFFFNSTVSVSSIMNRIYLLVIGFVLILCDVPMCECFNTFMSMYFFSFSGFYIGSGLFDLVEYCLCIYIIYILVNHSMEYLLKIFSIFNFSFFKYTFTKNLLVYWLIKYFMCKRMYLGKSSLLKVGIYIFGVLLSICSIYYVVICLIYYTDIIIINRFYINSLSYTLTVKTKAVCINNYLNKIESVSFFKNHYGFDYFNLYDYSNIFIIIKYYYLFRTSYDYMYSFTFLALGIYIWVSIPLLNNFIKFSIFRYLSNILYIITRLLHIKILCIILIILYSLYIYSNISVHSTLINTFNICIENIFYFRINSMDWLCSGNIFNYILDLYRFIYIKFITPWGTVVDNSMYFWTGTGCIFHKKYEDLSHIFLMELTPLTNSYKSNMLCIGHSTSSSIFNMCTQLIGIHSWCMSIGVDSKLFSNYMVLNSYRTDKPSLVSYVNNAFFDYGFYKSFILGDAFNLIDLKTNGIYILGANDEVCSYVYGISSKFGNKYYLHNEKGINYNMVYPPEHLFDYNSYYNCHTSRMYYSCR